MNAWKQLDVERWLYRHIARPMFFSVDPEKIHNAMVRTGRMLGSLAPLRACVRFLFSYTHPMLSQTLCGIVFPNPVGLAAGFDKNGDLVGILPAVGFGFAELGSVTLHPCEGNPPPRLRRLPRSKGIVVNYGLRNGGVHRFIARLRERVASLMPIGVSVARTNDGEYRNEEESRREYAECLRLLREANAGDYYTVNVSCPNECDEGLFLSPPALARLLGDIASLGIARPIFVKMPADLPWEKFHPLLQVIDAHGCRGVIIANLTKNRNAPHILDEIPQTVKGGISGKPVEPLADDLIRRAYVAFGDRLTIIGVGGIFSAEDAYRKIRLGASLVALITGMIYEGPQLIGQINRGLVALLRRDGFDHISHAVGADHRRNMR